MRAWISKSGVTGIAVLGVIAVALLFFRSQFVSVRFDGGFAVGVRRLEVLGCTRTNHMVITDLGWLHLTRVEPGGPLPGVPQPSQ